MTVEFVDGRTLSAKVVGTDPPSDLAVLKVAGPSFKTLPLADSSQVRVGDVVLAVGHPLGLGQTVTMGIISAKDRSTGAVRGGYEDFLQTDAPINRGNSGGALVNLRGELVGINSQIISPTGGNIGIGFAIPSTMAHDVMTQLLERGTVRRGLLGVIVQPISADMARSLDLAEPRGAIVTQVTEDGPAERAGVEQGDVILSLDGKPIDSSNALRNAVARLQPGTKVKLDLVRDGAKRSLTVALVERPANAEREGDDEDAPDDAQAGEAERPLRPRRGPADAGRRASAASADPHWGRRGGGRPGRPGQRSRHPAGRRHRLGEPHQGRGRRRAQSRPGPHAREPPGAAADRASRAAGLHPAGAPLRLARLR